MSRAIHFLFVLTIINLLIVLGQSRVLSLAGVNPNWLLVFSLLMVFAHEKIWLRATLILTTFMAAFLFFGFWLFELAVLLVLVFVMVLGRRFLTGNELTDFLITIFLLTIIFNLTTSFKSAASPDFSLIAKELVYNLILGVILWLINRNLLGLRRFHIFRSS